MQPTNLALTEGVEPVVAGVSNQSLTVRRRERKLYSTKNMHGHLLRRCIFQLVMIGQMRHQSQNATTADDTVTVFTIHQVVEGDVVQDFLRKRLANRIKPLAQQR